MEKRYDQRTKSNKNSVSRAPGKKNLADVLCPGEPNTFFQVGSGAKAVVQRACDDGRSNGRRGTTSIVTLVLDLDYLGAKVSQETARDGVSGFEPVQGENSNDTGMRSWVVLYGEWFVDDRAAVRPGTPYQPE